MKRRRRWAGFAASLAVGAVMGVLLWPMVQRELMFRRLFDDDGAQRQAAVRWWREPASGGATGQSRLETTGDVAARLSRRLEAAPSEAVFVDVASLMRETGQWRFPIISTALWRRRLELILGSGDDAAARSVIDELAAADVARDDADAAALWTRVIGWPGGASIRCAALLHAARWFGRDGAEAYVAAARDDDDARVRRLAWLLLGHLHPKSGYAAQWRGEVDEVAEAMLWAATVTDRDNASPLLAACDDAPWPTRALPWLLSRSDDPAGKARLESLLLDGNPSAALPLAEQWGMEVERLTSAQQAWLGGDVESAERDVRLRRWAAWRRGSGDADELLAGPVAEDGSVWAAVLLAERLLDDEARAEVARRWLSDVDPAMRSAGAMLEGLRGGDGWRLSEEYAESRDARFRRAARLGMIMANASANAGDRSGDAAYAWTIASSQPGERLDAIMALLASGDAQAAESILMPPAESAAGAALLERAWLIERFLPRYAPLVAPLSPWNDQVAALQLDIMRTAFALDGGAGMFDVEKRVFGSAAAPSPAH